MPELVLFNRQFSPRWQMTAVTTIVIAFFIYLGMWQLQRAGEKKEMIAREAQLSTQAPLAWEPGMANPKQYQSVIVQGFFLPEVFLLDNQHYQHQFGFNILTPIQLTSGSVVVIDRGWVAGDPARKQFPVVKQSGQFVKLSGQAYYPSDKTRVLGQVLEKISTNLAILERIDTHLVSQFLHKSVYPFIIRLSPNEANGYVREWPVVSMSPERHNAYAIQWFAMALVILAIFIGLHLKKPDEKNET